MSCTVDMWQHLPQLAAAITGPPSAAWVCVVAIKCFFKLLT